VTPEPLLHRRRVTLFLSGFARLFAVKLCFTVEDFHLILGGYASDGGKAAWVSSDGPEKRSFSANRAAEPHEEKSFSANRAAKPRRWQ